VRRNDISSAGLHILAMALMLIDHLGILIFPGNVFLRSVGRLAFPIFAFLLIEGYQHTRSLSKYLLRLLAGAAIAEIPYNVMVSGSIFCPWHQNVLTAFILGLLVVTAVDKALFPPLLAIPVGYTAGELCMVDYGGAGVLMMLSFYLFSNQPLMLLVSQIALNWFLIGSRMLELALFGKFFSFPMQAFAVLALVPIWLYKGRQGYHSKWFRVSCYIFYPAHIAVLWLIRAMMLST